MSDVANVPQGATEVTPVTQAAETNPEVNAAETPAATPVDRTVKYKYNHAEEVLDLSKPEDMEKAAEYLREGRYALEKGKAELSSYKDNKGVQWFLQKAKEFHVDPAELADKWGKDLEDKIINEYADANDLTPEEAKKQMAKDGELADIRAELKAIKDKQEQDDKINAQIKELTEAGIPVSSITDDIVKTATEQGISLKAAYNLSQLSAKDAEIAELKKKLDIKEANDKNANSSMPAVTGAGGAETEIDDNFVENVYPKMPYQERQKFLDRVEAFIRGGNKKK